MTETLLLRNIQLPLSSITTGNVKAVTETPIIQLDELEKLELFDIAFAKLEYVIY